MARSKHSRSGAFEVDASFAFSARTPKLQRRFAAGDLTNGQAAASFDRRQAREQIPRIGNAGPRACFKFSVFDRTRSIQNLVESILYEDQILLTQRYSHAILFVVVHSALPLPNSCAQRLQPR